ncbi:HEAT repeat domain-containing protein [Solwaraspora sp. WMMD1047]|uniref:HEAT repeat domain-containing protein n=1 Tax=Solwaraspora sp. WMMD1047 TaxID=3016102 RepID=UPI0024163B15|nr:HEAT repeat domain-containing protein [Solwaraspora sp. WMMD1047]MDG4828129.1 HEAT repeat domain-containing protein [Solwaraspora sp. WMMD1047]
MPERSEALRIVDWASLVDVYGPAGDLPQFLHAVWSENAGTRRKAYETLARRLVHQGSRFDASAVAAGFLVDVVADPQAPDRFAACQVLRMIAIGDEGYWLIESPDIAAIRRRVARQASMTLQELDRERSMWVAAASEGERRAREWTARYVDVEADRRTEQWDLAAYDAVRSGVAVYVAALRSANPAVRLHAAHLLAWFPEERDQLVPALTRLINEEPEPIVASTACVAAGLCGATENDAELVEALSRRRAGSSRVERWSAVLGSARLSTRPPRPIIEELYACLLEAPEPVPNWPFLSGDMSGLAALTLSRLSPEVALDRVAILARRIAGTESGPERFTLVGALLEAAFPEQAEAGRGCDTEARQTAIRALLDNGVWRDGPMVAMLLAQHDLPTDPEAARGWDQVTKTANLRETGRGACPAPSSAWTQGH